MSVYKKMERALGATVSTQTQKVRSISFRECFFRNILARLHCCLLDIHSCSICSFALWRDCARVFAGCRIWKKPCCRCCTCTAFRLCVSVSGVSGSSSQWTLQDKGGKRMAARLCESAGAPLHGPICLSGTHRSYRQSSGRKTGPGLQNPVVLLQQKHSDGSWPLHLHAAFVDLHTRVHANFVCYLN